MSGGPTIAGTTRIFGLIADPVRQLRTPQRLNALFAEQGVDAVMVPLHVAAADLPVVWQGLLRQRNFAGLVATIPHKQAIAGLCDRLGPQATLAGSVNVVRREADGCMVGETFDGIGFVAGLRASGCDPAGREVLLLGAGGAAVSIAFALAGAGIVALTVANRSAGRAQALAAAVGRAFPAVACSWQAEADPAGMRLVVNATPLGLSPDDPPPLDPERLEPGCIVAEAVIAPAPTALARGAERAGCRTIGGEPMLAGQIGPIFDYLRAATVG